MQFTPNNDRIEAQLIAARYLADKLQEKNQRRINAYFYAMAGLVVTTYIGAMTFIIG
jgi:uncharacterized membrane protein